MTENTKWQRSCSAASHHGHVHGVSVRITVHGHRADAHLLGRAHHTTRNLPSIGNQHLLYPSNPWRGHNRLVIASSKNTKNNLKMTIALVVTYKKSKVQTGFKGLATITVHGLCAESCYCWCNTNVLIITTTGNLCVSDNYSATIYI